MRQSVQKYFASQRLKIQYCRYFLLYDDLLLVKLMYPHFPFGNATRNIFIDFVPVCLTEANTQISSQAYIKNALQVAYNGKT